MAQLLLVVQFSNQKKNENCGLSLPILGTNRNFTKYSFFSYRI